MCNTMYKRRMKGYRAAGYQVADIYSQSNDLEKGNAVFTIETYENALQKDVLEARESVVFALNDTYLNKRSSIYHKLSTLLVRGVNIEVVVRKSSSNDCLWQELGIYPIIKDSLTIQAVIIDRKLVWYGDINYLGRNVGEETSIRLQDNSLSNELLDALYNNHDKTTNKP